MNISDFLLQMHLAGVAHTVDIGPAPKGAIGHEFLLCDRVQVPSANRIFYFAWRDGSLITTRSFKYPILFGRLDAGS